MRITKYYAYLLLACFGCCLFVSCNDKGDDEQPEQEVTYNKNGIWLWSSHLENADFKRLKDCGIDNVFLHEYAFTSLGAEHVGKRLAEAKAAGVRTHIWIQCFYANDKWINPVDTEKKEYNQALFNSIIEKAENYAAMPDVAGIHLDYVRYPGTAYLTNFYPVTGMSAVTEFVRQLTHAVKDVDSKVLISAAVMGETKDNAYYYGQKTEEMGAYLDIIIPMIYRYNYNKNVEWIGTTARWYVEHAGKAEIWAGLQTYAGDSNVTQLLPSELEIDCKSLVGTGAKGIVLFRYGLYCYLDVSEILTD
jgi:hypothetical protein